MFRGLKLGEITKPYHLAEHCKNATLVSTLTLCNLFKYTFLYF